MHHVKLFARVTGFAMEQMVLESLSAHLSTYIRSSAGVVSNVPGGREVDLCSVFDFFTPFPSHATELGELVANVVGREVPITIDGRALICRPYLGDFAAAGEVDAD